ncbi:hypothetical protein DFH08DRAFT_776959 [Mycena albidolilacea]|uniref:Uncharacterized protein n=1 Tax=Mycena albidolilacea TaxID=1033008 RepID=A0AAD7ETM6_9AGAR|nr:hypothetical protein DFH08DRAFT_776959 [Mycena albidolilacea]
MGTRGYRVYRHKGYYHVHYNHWDSYPSNLGVKVAAEVPQNEEEYRKWLKNLREALDHHFENNKDHIDSEGAAYRITTSQVTNDIWIEWIYEIDLDHEVFLIDSNPMFALNNMPDSEDLFLECIQFDAYGHRACGPSTPEKHRYEWKASPPNVDHAVIDEYAARHSDSDIGLPISELLGTTGLVNSCEAARHALYEVIIGGMMTTWEIGHSIRTLETATDRASVSGDLLAMGVDMVQVAFGRMLFGRPIEIDKPDKVKKTVPVPPEFSWLAPDVCLRITTHLDDEPNLKRSILELVGEVALNRQLGHITYGVLFSFFHCVIVRVDLQNGFKSTAVLQFLPSFYATSPSTPGIAALSSLAYHCLDTPAPPSGPEFAVLNPNHFLHQVPHEVFELITDHLAPSDLTSLCAAAPPFEPASQSILCFPHIEEYRLVQGAPEMIEDALVENDYGEMTTKKGGPSLLCKLFSTVVCGSVGPVLAVGGEAGYNGGFFPIPLGGKGREVGWEVKKGAA